MSLLIDNPLCRPFWIDGSREHGILLIHGFTATPGTMNPLGRALAEKTGYTVAAPLLPGHGRTPEDMAKTRWHDWLRGAQHAFDKLSRQCKDVSVVGLSMGGALTLLLAETRPVRRAVPIAAALSAYNEKIICANALWPVWRFFTEPEKEHEVMPDFLYEYNDTYDKTPVHCLADLNRLMRLARQGLPRIHCPIMNVRAGKDRTIHPRSTGWIMTEVSSRKKVLLELPRSPHVCTLGPERELLFEETAKFLMER